MKLATERGQTAAVCCTDRVTLADGERGGQMWFRHRHPLLAERLGRTRLAEGT